MNIKTLTRFCLKFNKKIDDLKICFLCEEFQKKDNNESPIIDLPKLAITPALAGHFRFNACKFNQYYDVSQLAEKNILPKSITKISQATKKFLKKMHHKPEIIKTTIISKWPKIAGKVFEKNVIPLKFSRGTLIVKTESPVISQNFVFVKNEIINNINNILNDDIVKRIKIEQ